ncbi:hypothetical protein [Oceanibaculum indicum]|uniref:Uncharacterized protein n=1 Tax=Oceanibaculum indicum TaxID=526216 RepID=A0A420WGP0_9PROT|nr:hypothetical protein [Oceanibaculum indicum]RKQ70147.1 hypothetical protein BCL74_2087 [Oceanibaculum indicum]
MMTLTELEGHAHTLANRCTVAELRNEVLLDLIAAHRTIFARQRDVQESRKVLLAQQGRNDEAKAALALADEMAALVRRIDSTVAEMRSPMELAPAGDDLAKPEARHDAL